MNMIPVSNSSNVAAYGYDLETKSLIVEFLTGTTYRYFDVPESSFEAMQRADSKGGFLNAEIKPRYSAKRVMS